MPGKANNQSRIDKTQISLVCFIAGIVTITFFTLNFTHESLTAQADDYASCVEAGGATMGGQPPTCSINDKTFTFSLESVPGSNPQLDTFRGKVTAIDYSPLKTSGYIPITVQVEDTSSNGFFVATTGDCNEQAKKMMQAKEIQINDAVEVQIKHSREKSVNGLDVSNIGFSRVCDDGTFIKKL